MWWRRVRWILTLIVLCSIATCPSAKRSCTARNRAREADELLTVIGDRVALSIATTGKVPPTPAGPTPATSCCDAGGTCAADASTWTAQGWRELQFSIDGAYRYTYQYIPDPGGQSAVVRAAGDLNCDGLASIYELRLTVQAGTVRRTWQRKNPYE